MTRESQPPREVLEAVNSTAGLSAIERQAVSLYADLRRRAQELRKATLNLELPGATEAMRLVYNEQTALVGREAKGEDGTAGEVKKPADNINEFLERANLIGELFPELAALYYAEAAKMRQMAADSGASVELLLDYLLGLAREKCDQTKDLPKSAPSSLLADAIILGTERRLARETPLPSQEKIAPAIATNPALAADWAIILSEKDRADFLSLFSDDAIRAKIGREIDLALAPLLHQAIVEKEGEEPSQRLKVRSRLFQELKSTVEQPKTTDKTIARQLAETLGTLGEDTRQLLLELVRDATEDTDRKTAEQPGHIPRVIKVFLDNFDDWRGNDVILKLAGDARLNKHLALYLFGKLCAKGYLTKDVAEWWKEHKQAGKARRRSLTESERASTATQNENRRLEVLRSVVTGLSVMPSREILEFIYEDKNWEVREISERVAEIHSKQAGFDRFTERKALVAHLRGDEHAAMIYYLLHGGEDRFNLINNYSFAKFKEMLGLIDQLRPHEDPLTKFENALKQGGLKVKDTKAIRERLEGGHYPLPNEDRAYQEASFEVSENAAIKNANAEIGRTLSKHELGVALLFPVYREYLARANSPTATALAERMTGASTFSDRERLITEIDSAFSDWREMAKNDLQDNWKKLGEKMLLEATIENVLTDEQVVIRGEDLIPRLDAKRLDLKKMKKDLLVALRGGNERVKAVASEIARKKKALGGLRQGLERAKPENKTKMEQQITDIETQLAALEKERMMVADMKVEDRFADLLPAERKQKIEELGKEIIALTEKSPSAIFTFITMQVLGEERLRESDVALIQELESHLQGPFQTIQDTLTYQRPTPRGEEKKRQRVGLHYVDKAKQLMHLVRFADSKICCFSSNNYEMIVLHDMPNKYWVASINADPLSFVISMEVPQGAEAAKVEKNATRENLGFIFGNFAVNENGDLAIMLNGIYYAPGIEDSAQVAAILEGVEKIFKEIPIKTMVLASQHGGAIKMPEGFSNSPITLTRLRALDDGSGNQETRIYDDIGTGSRLNQPMDYGGHVWHKNVA